MLETRASLFLFCSILLVAGVASAAGPVSYYKDVQPIIQENCQTCHRPLGVNNGGMIAPMSFMTYKEVRPWAKAIGRAVVQRAMPPWHAGREQHGVFANERTLSDSEIDTIARWVKGGAPAGSRKNASADSTSYQAGSGEWSIGEPDLVIAMDPYFVDDVVEDLNISFTTVLTEEELPADRWISAIEYKAGSEVVHHICNSAVAPNNRFDETDFSNRIGLGCIAPGSDARATPEGFGTLLPKGATIRWGMHYHKEPGPGTGLMDVSQMAFIFSDVPIKHEVKFDVISSGNRWEVPPNHASWEVGAARTFDEPTTILSFLPHMHFRGKAAEYKIYYPDGTDEVVLNVPNYDYNWQTIYKFAEPKEVPAGARIEVKMWYDNSPESGEALGLISDRPVAFGLPTTEEMMNGWIGYANTIPRDVEAEARSGTRETTGDRLRE